MKKLFVIVLAALSAISSFAYNPEIRDIDITVSLDAGGTAHIVEKWDVVVSSGTEWYLVRENLGDINIQNLAVCDESGRKYLNEGSWDVDRSLDRKAGKCGLHRTGAGYEICWGVGSYGPHVFTVSYDMTNAVKTLNDYDMLHMQFVSDELSAAPQHVRLKLTAPVALSEENSRIWGFGYNGSTKWSGDGSVVAESSEPFSRYSSMILLLRFDKGIFESGSVQDKDFQSVLDRAMEGAGFEDEEEEEKWYEILLGMVMSVGFLYLFLVYPIKRFLQGIGLVNVKSRRRIKQIFGVRRLPSHPDWSRELPFGGNYLRTYYIASHLNGVDDKKLSVISAMLLRMVGHGNIDLKEDTGGKKEFHFRDDSSRAWMSNAELEFYKMLKEASGADVILQEKEFKRWASKHETEVKNWVTDLQGEVRKSFSDSAIAANSKYYETISLTPEGQRQAMQALGFRQFLKDFTIINERRTPEVGLWGEYLVVASLFGMADKVAAEMKHLSPEIKLGDVSIRTANLYDVLTLSDMFRSSTRSTYNNAMARSARSSYGGGSFGGFGGGSSFGGGGGFSGGGHGGGSR